MVLFKHNNHRNNMTLGLVWKQIKKQVYKKMVQGLPSIKTKLKKHFMLKYNDIILYFPQNYTR